MSADRPSVRLQPLTRARAETLGPVGSAWAAGLPDQLAALAQQWSLTLGRPLPGGSTSYVVSARNADGRDVVLKLVLPASDLADQVAALRNAQGRGYAQLLAYDPDRRALLLEALGPSLEQSGYPVADQLRLLAETLAIAWQPAADHHAGPADKAGGLHDLVSRLWVELDRPCPEAVITQALTYADRCRTVDATELVVVHGDPHPGNLLRAAAARPGAETGYCFVDPDGFVADRAYDLGVVIRDWAGQLGGPGARAVLEGYCELLAEHSGVDATRIWEWGFLERVSTGLYAMSFGAHRAAAPFLRTAASLLD